MLSQLDLEQYVICLVLETSLGAIICLVQAYLA